MRVSAIKGTVIDLADINAVLLNAVRGTVDEIIVLDFVALTIWRGHYVGVTYGLRIGICVGWIDEVIIRDPLLCF